MLTRDHTVLPATHTFIHKWNEPYLPLLPSRRASPHFWLVLISRPTEGRRPSWHRRLGEMLRWFPCPKMVTHPSISRSGWESSMQPSNCESNALTTRLPSHLNLAWYWRNLAKHIKSRRASTKQKTFWHKINTQETKAEFGQLPRATFSPAMDCVYSYSNS